MNNPLARLSRKQLGIGGSILLGVAGVIVGLALSQGKAPQKAIPSTTTTTSPPVPPTPPRTASDRCPLTDLKSKGGVPKRPALAVKIGNEPHGARPQSGLDEADIVFDTPAEGFIMRYIAVYQCGNAASLGPTRSVRWVDWHVVRQFIKPILAFAGGINPNVDQVDAFHWLRAANLLNGAQSAGTRITSRSPPDNLYTSTASLYHMFPKSTRVPKPVFDFSKSVPSGAVPAADLSINFSFDTDVVWKWDQKSRSWLHTFSGTPDVDALSHRPVTAKNVVVLLINYKFGPFAESTGGSGDFESQTQGRGVGYVLRDGKSIKVTWHRKNLVDPFTFSRAHNENVTLAPGRTWVELVPDTTPMSLTR